MQLLFVILLNCFEFVLRKVKRILKKLGFLIFSLIGVELIQSRLITVKKPTPRLISKAIVSLKIPAFVFLFFCLKFFPYIIC